MSKLLNPKKRREKRDKKKYLQRFSAQTPRTCVENFYMINPFFYDKNKIFWLWNEIDKKYEIVDEIQLFNELEEELELHGQTYVGHLYNEYVKNFKIIGANKRNKPKIPPKEWIQFKDKIYDLKNNETRIATSDYFFTNPIPFEIGTNPSTPTMDNLFEDWVGYKYVQTLYQIIAYCCYRDYPIQLLFGLLGSGRNGKSQFLKVIDKFIGEDNTTTTDLDLLGSNRFESFKLYKKLVAFMGETNFGVLNKTNLLKKLTGGDKIGYEKKNKDPFDDYNYAKIIIASNSLPTSEDTSDGFYRRWLIIDFPNEFEDVGIEIWKTIPEEEYNNLAKKITLILPELLENGIFHNQGSIEERQRKYIESSNPLTIFIHEKCNCNDELYVKYSQLYMHYSNYLLKNKKRRVTKKEFRSALEIEGYYIDRTTKEGESTFWIIGLDLKQNNHENVENVENV